MFQLILTELLYINNVSVDGIRVYKLSDAVDTWNL